MRELINPGDQYQMNWIEGAAEWGTVKAPEGLDVKVTSEREGDLIKERYTFTNCSGKDLFTSRRDIGIYTPFNDDYTTAEECVTNRCHTHIWCGGEVSYVMALRMGGEAPHLGLVLTEGSLCGYSVERDLSRMSNDRGDFLLHPSPVRLVPGESFTVAWILFWHDGKRDFYEKLPQYCPRYMAVSAEHYVVFGGERIRITVQPAFAFAKQDVNIRCGGKPCGFTISGGKILVDELPDDPGEYRYDIAVKGVHTFCRVLAQPELETLAARRCEFMVRNQQYHNPHSGLDGAYLIYDHEEGHIWYNRQYDRNGGRERIGMGLLLAKYLQRHVDDNLDQSLKAYIAYVERELLNAETGEVFNDYGRDNSYKRLYNDPWMSRFYLELYALYHEKKYVITAYRILKHFYDQGGARFYAIEIPLVQILAALRENGMTAEREELLRDFRAHCAFIMERGIRYPAHEVNFEQSISAPAAYLLLELYEATREERYLTAAKTQLDALELFNGLQPDYHLYETAIRHWDGYWFGKRRLYGDTFPHYWSALTANVYRAYADAAGDESYRVRAEAAYRSVLSLIHPDGSASCAYVYPVSVNGEPAEFYDPYANDQDWGLYFMLRYRYAENTEETRA